MRAERIKEQLLKGGNRENDAALSHREIETRTEKEIHEAAAALNKE